MTVRDEIIQLIKSQIKEKNVIVESPREREHGDYSTNVALRTKNPSKEAEDLKKSLVKNKMFEDIKIVNGFINFFISEGYLKRELKKILKEKEKFGSSKMGKGKKIQVEFISANPTGPLTVANARGGPFGDVLGNVFEKAGFKASKAYYLNDCDNQILKLGHYVLKDKENEYKREYIDYLNKKIKEKDPYLAGEKAAKIITEEMIKKTVKSLGVKFDEWSSEKSFHKSNAVDKTLNLLKKKKLIYEKEGAVWFKSTKFGDDRDRVVIKSNGDKTYLAGDIAYHKYKFDNFDKVINIWGSDHHGDVPGLKAGVEALGFAGKLDIILLQFVTLFEKDKKLRMSKRKGIYVTMDELLDKVGVDVARFFFLEKAANTHLNFDLSLAKEQSEKNPVFHIQYAHARICSILKKVKSKNIKEIKTSLDINEKELIKRLLRFSEIIEDTVNDYQVQRITKYALELAESFHKFYSKCKVITEDKEIMNKRLAIILATKIVLKNTLDLMGISSPEKM